MLFQDFNWIRTSDLVAPWGVRNTDSQNLSTLSSYTKNSSRSVQATCYIIQQNTTNWWEPEGRRPPTGGVIGVQWSGWSSVRTPMHSHKSGWSSTRLMRADLKCYLKISTQTIIILCSKGDIENQSESKRQGFGSRGKITALKPDLGSSVAF